jgi:hypothetical protein
VKTARFPLLAVILVAIMPLTRAVAGGMRITSPDFAEGAAIPARFTCEGQNSPPALVIAAVPAAARSLALVVDDPDAPGGTFTHWLVWNIPPGTKRIGDVIPPGVLQGANDFGSRGYSGPCPPSGTHRYFFRLSALDTILHLAAGASRDDFDAAIRGHALATAELMGRFSKSGAR